MNNLPADWACYYHMCEQCGKRYHSSGCELCDCESCNNCGEWQPQDLWTLDPDGEVCDTCYEKEEYVPDKWDLADIAYAEYKDNPPEDREDYNDKDIYDD